MKTPEKNRLYLTSAVCLLLTACPALPFLIPPALEFARNLLNTSSQNYSQQYTSRLEQLLVAMSRTNLTSAISGQPGMPVASYSGQGYPGGPGYPAGQPYPPVSTTATFPAMPVPDYGQQQVPYPQAGGIPPPGYPGAGAVPQGYPPGYPPNYPAGGTVPGTPSPYGSTYPPAASGYPTYPGGNQAYPPSGYQTNPATPYGSNPAYGSTPGYGQTPGAQPGGYPQTGYPTTGYPATDPNQQQYAQGYGQGGYPAAQNPYQQQQPGTQPYGQTGYPAGTNPYQQQQPGTQPYGQTGYPAGTNPYQQQQPGTQPYGQTGYPTGTNPYQQQPAAQQYQPQPGAQGYGQPGYPGTGYAAAPGYPTYRSVDPPGPNAAATTGQAGSAQPVSGMPAAPIGLQVALLKQVIKDGQKTGAIMEDGDVVKDGRGDAAAGDKFKIVFQPDADGYVYIVSIDGSGWAQGLFPGPQSSTANPVSKDRIYVLPEGNNWFSLDQYRGIETIYFVASYQRRPDIEETLQTITGRERPATAVPQQVTEPAVIPGGYGSSAPGKVTTIKADSGAASQVNLTAFHSRQPNEDLRVTRWFKHE